MSCFNSNYSIVILVNNKEINSKFIVFQIDLFRTYEYFQEDPLDIAMENCLNKLQFLELAEISEKQEDCLAGCMLQEFKMVNKISLDIKSISPVS